MSLTSILELLFWLLLGAVLSLGADVALKQSNFQNMKFLSIGVVLYAASAIPVAIGFKLSSFGLFFIAWELLMVVAGIAIATTFYHEPLTSSRIAAVCFACVALFLAQR